MASHLLAHSRVPVHSFGGSRNTMSQTKKAQKQKNCQLPNTRQGFEPCRARQIDWTDPDTLIGAAGAFLGLALGIGVPVFYLSRDAKDREKLESVREMNRKRFEETGAYMTEEEIAAIRPPKWTDRREFADDD